MTPDILVGTKKGLYLLGEQGQQLFQDEEVGFVTTQNGAWWVVINKGEIWRFSEAVWDHVQTLEGIRVNCLVPHKDQILLGTSRAHLYKLNAESPHQVETFERISNRDQWFTPWGGPPDVRSISMDSAGNIFVNVHVGGILRSMDAGKSWEPTIDLRTDVHQVYVHQATDTILAPSGHGLAMSSDHGQSWSFDKDGLHGSYQRAVAVAGDFVLVSSSTGPYTKHAAIYRKSLGRSGPFEQCASGLPEWFTGNIDTFCLDACGPSVAFGTESGEVYFSDDTGQTWSRIADGLSSVRGLTFI
jgi:hypothetical protein